VERPRPIEGFEAAVVVERSGRFLLLRRGEVGLWRGFWEFPTISTGGADPAGRRETHGVEEESGFVMALRRLTGVTVGALERLKTIRYGVTRYRMTMDVYRSRLLTGRVRVPAGFAAAEWVEPGGLGERLLSAPNRRVARVLAEGATG
jgi:A/G-specific adenine glycosylase